MTTTHFAAAVLSVSLLAPQARGESHPTAPDGSRVETLKAAYLACDRETSSHRMDPTTAGRCMDVSSELMQLAFDGDFDRLIAWWRAAKARPPGCAPAAAEGRAATGC